MIVFGGGELDIQRRKDFEYHVLSLRSLFFLIALLHSNKTCKVFIHGAWSFSFLYIYIAQIFNRFKLYKNYAGNLDYVKIDGKNSPETIQKMVLEIVE